MIGRHRPRDFDTHARATHDNGRLYCIWMMATAASACGLRYERRPSSAGSAGVDEWCSRVLARLGSCTVSRIKSLIGD